MQANRYDPAQVQPMRDELTKLGFDELLTPQAVEAAIADSNGTILLVVNSVCGCAAGSARPGVKLALEKTPRPDRLCTVFAGMEIDAVEKARTYFVGYPPSSPQMGLIKNGQLVYMMERQNIEGRSAEQVAADLEQAFAQHCEPA